MPRRLSSALALLALLLPAVPVAAEDFPPPPRSGWEAGWHVVRPGDTLEGLARRLLGSHLYWRELHRLNPGIADPDLLLPGQRIRIWIERPAPLPNAQVETVAGRVDERPQPVPWRPAAEGDLLLERDGVRTFASGSSRLRFDDGTAVTLTENSLVFIHRQPPAATPVPRQEIEVQVGQADLEAAPRPGRAPAIDIVFGEARARAGGTAEAGLAARTGAERGGAARLMIYRGRGELAAAGETVDLAAGTGSTVEPKQPPRPAEALLAAPVPDLPEPDAQLGLDDPWLTWKAVPGAAGYAVEVCADEDCARLIERATGVAETRYRLAGAPAQSAFWRVRATSASGLAGFPSAPRRFVTVPSVPPPPPTLVLRGADGAALDGGACSASLPALEVSAADRYGRPLPWTLEVDGRQVAPAEAFSASRAYRVAAVAHAPSGLTSTSPERTFVLDRSAPFADLPSLPAPAATVPPNGFVPRHALAAACAAGLEFAVGDGPWAAVPCALSSASSPAPLRIDGATASLRLRAARRARLGGDLPLDPGVAVTLDLGDLGCGLAAGALAIAADPAGRAGLALELVDHAGRQGRRFWVVEKR
jgi:hypothetical protein